MGSTGATKHTNTNTIQTSTTLSYICGVEALIPCSVRGSSLVDSMGQGVAGQMHEPEEDLIGIAALQ